MPPRVVLPLVLLASLVPAALPLPNPAEGTWVAQVAWLNDGVAALEIPAGHHLFPYSIDDNGFTNGLAASVAGHTGWGELHLHATWLNITERAAGGPTLGTRRWDTLEVTLARVARGRVGPLTWLVAPRVGVEKGGDLGGLWVQSGFHASTGISGRTAGHGLQTDYAGAPGLGLTCAVLAGATLDGPAWTFARGSVDGQGAVGTAGLERLQGLLAVGVRHRWREVAFRLEATAEVGLVHPLDAGLRFPGSYVRGPFVSPGLGAFVEAGPLAVGWLAEFNAQGTGFPDGAVVLSWGAPAR